VYPFYGLDKPELCRHIDQGLYLLNRQLTISPICLDFINRCLLHDPNKRFSWAQIEVHPFFNHKEYYRVLERVSFAMSLDKQGQSLVLQELPQHIANSYRQSGVQVN
jgi:serine/threonine protein kinase